MSALPECRADGLHRRVLGDPELACTVTAYVQPPTGTSPDTPDGMREYQGRDPYALQWQRLVADFVCRRR